MRRVYAGDTGLTYPSCDEPTLGALWGVLPPYPGEEPVFVVEDGDGTLWEVFDLADWYNGRRAAKRLARPGEAVA